MSRDGIPESGRRRYPRLVVEKPVPVVDVTIDAPMSLEDVSLGGFRSRSPVPAEPGSRHRFRIEHPAVSTEVVARAIHCHGLPDRGAYAIGWQWGSDSLTANARVHLMAAIADAQRVMRSAALFPRAEPDAAASGRS